jgi:hypothetical protein
MGHDLWHEITLLTLLLPSKSLVYLLIRIFGRIISYISFLSIVGKSLKVFRSVNFKAQYSLIKLVAFRIVFETILN